MMREAATGTSRASELLQELTEHRVTELFQVVEKEWPKRLFYDCKRPAEGLNFGIVEELILFGCQNFWTALSSTIDYNPVMSYT